MATNGNGKTATTPFAEALEAEIKRRQVELEALIQARNVLRAHTQQHDGAPAAHNGGDNSAGSMTVSEGVERLLQIHRELHLDEILKQLQLQFGIRVSRKNLANTLNRWLSRGKKFDRIKANTYTLR